MIKSKVSENDILNGCLQILSVMGIFAFRVNNGGVKRESGYSFKGLRGISDIMGCYRGRMICIECKAPGKCNTQSDYQKAFQINIENQNGIYILTDDPHKMYAELKDKLNKIGVWHEN